MLSLSSFHRSLPKTKQNNNKLQRRCEYAVLGDIVNLSARLMCAAAKQNHPIMVDHETYKEAKNGFEFIVLDKIEVRTETFCVLLRSPPHSIQRKIFFF